MGNEGKAMLDRALANAIESTNQPQTGTGFCGAHDPIRQGVNVLLLCEQERQKNGSSPTTNNNYFRFGKLNVGGFGLIILLFCVYFLGTEGLKWGMSKMFGG